MSTTEFERRAFEHRPGSFHNKSACRRRSASLCAAAPRRYDSSRALIMTQIELPETVMYIGGGLLGTVLLIVLVVYLLRRA